MIVKKVLCTDAIILYAWAMSKSLPYDEIKIDRKVKLEGILKNPYDCDIGYLLDVDIKYLDEINKKPRFFHLLSKKK